MIQCYRWVVRDRETNKPIATVVAEDETKAKTYLKYEQILSEKIHSVEVFYNGSTRVKPLNSAIL